MILWLEGKVETQMPDDVLQILRDQNPWVIVVEVARHALDLLVVPVEEQFVCDAFEDGFHELSAAFVIVADSSACPIAKQVDVRLDHANTLILIARALVAHAVDHNHDYILAAIGVAKQGFDRESVCFCHELERPIRPAALAKDALRKILHSNNHEVGAQHFER
jgi:hypothetical protein